MAMRARVAVEVSFAEVGARRTGKRCEGRVWTIVLSRRQNPTKEKEKENEKENDWGAESPARRLLKNGRKPSVGQGATLNQRGGNRSGV